MKEKINNFNNFNKFNKINNSSNSNKNNGETMITKINFADHEQRMLMDGLKNILEALIDGQPDIAECISKSHPDLSQQYELYKNMSEKQLLQERLNQIGYEPDDKLNYELEKILESM